MKSTWYARIRIEKNGDCAEHDGTIDIEYGRGTPPPTARSIEHSVTALLLANYPHLRGGRVTARDIRKIR